MHFETLPFHCIAFNHFAPAQLHNATHSHYLKSFIKRILSLSPSRRLPPILSLLKKAAHRTCHVPDGNSFHFTQYANKRNSLPTPNQRHIPVTKPQQTADTRHGSAAILWWRSFIQRHACSGVARWGQSCKCSRQIRTTRVRAWSSRTMVIVCEPSFSSAVSVSIRTSDAMITASGVWNTLWYVSYA